MILDALIVIFILFFFGVGMFKGGVVQCLNVLAFLAALVWLLSGLSFVESLAKNFWFPKILPLWVINLIFSIVLYLLIVLLGKMLKYRFFSDKFWKKIDLLLGGLVGFLKGSLIVSVIIFFTTSVPDWVSVKEKIVSYCFKESKIFSMVYQYNPLSFINVYKFCSIIDRDFADEDMGDIEILEEKVLSELLENEKLRQAVKEKNFLLFFNDPQVKEVAHDQEVVYKIIKFNIRATIDRVKTD